MRRLLFVTRFFLVVPVVAPAMAAGFVLTTGAGIAAITIDAAYARRVIAPVLLLQLFATASGFRVPARRGHYDLLLTSGAARLLVVLVHWTLSAAPGLVSWGALALTERVNGGNVLTGWEVMATTLLVSTLPWALTVPLSRMTGAILWLFGSAAVRAIVPSDSWTRVIGPAAAAGIVLVSFAVVVLWILRTDFPLEPGQ
jgi:hypothetical protein